MPENISSVVVGYFHYRLQAIRRYGFISMCCQMILLPARWLVAA
ncbi:hypothetical protein CSC17_5577 [Klebsiella oxytoca]|nr:hypothetical protein CSC17_5577 [Klebsiella oxytoca]